FYIASGFQNKHLVHSVANELKHAGWHHTYDWTKNERAANEEQLREIGQAERNAVKEADVFLLILDGGNG
ncbi:group-specific protein, partial [Bacillus cereus]